jgi:uncharacterized paraquat-inducible protein A
MRKANQPRLLPGEKTVGRKRTDHVYFSLGSILFACVVVMPLKLNTILLHVTVLDASSVTSKSRTYSLS